MSMRDKPTIWGGIPIQRWAGNFPTDERHHLHCR